MTDKKITLLSDGDDFLWPNEWYYSRARTRFFLWLYEEFRDLMPTYGLVKDRYHEIDRELFPLWGVEEGVISTGMQETYDELVAWFGKKLGEDSERFQQILQQRREHVRIVDKFGKEPFDFSDLRWIEGVEETLSALKATGRFSLCLLTSYDEKVWQYRREHLGVDRFFDQVTAIPGKKKSQDFIDASGYDGAPSDSLFYAMGNGTSDILPALEVSEQWRGIYIPHASGSPVFHGEDEKVEWEDPYTPPAIDDSRVITLRNFKDLRRIDFENFRLKDPS